jgi:hypothetical protein
VVRAHSISLIRVFHSLFYEVMTENVEQRCLASLLPQFGQTTSPSSYSARDRSFEKSLLHTWHGGCGPLPVLKGYYKNSIPLDRL